jgi:hypothetical protein
MIDGYGYDGVGTAATPLAVGPGTANAGLAGLLAAQIGKTVTIFTTSGGESGSGFTGVILAVTPCFVRIVTHIGPAPACALGNCCDGMLGGVGGGYGGGAIRTVGAVTDIPLDRIAAFVHSATR